MKAALAIVLVVLVTAGYSALSFMRKVHISEELVRNTIPYSLNGPHTVNVLVLGDSTAVGVGARVKEESLAALFSNAVRATNVENRAISGARVADLTREIELTTERSYRYILIGIGANDIVRFKSADEAALELTTAITQLPKYEHLVVYVAGNVGATQLFPWLLNKPYTELTLAYHEAFKRVVESERGIYIDLYEPPERDPFVRDPDRYFAADGFHPSSAGYRIWFEKMVPVLE